MNWKDDFEEEMGYTICPICFPEYVHCDEDCENCKEYIEFKQNVSEGGCESDSIRNNINYSTNGNASNSRI